MIARRRALIALTLGFVLLGMPGSALGVAWPSIADQLTRSLGDLGILTLVNGAAYGVMSLSSGTLTQRYRAGIVLTGASVAATASLAMFGGAGSFVWLALASVPLGLAGGALDSIGNGYVAVHHGARPMGAIHAAFGLGSMIAPLLMTGIDAAGASWRVGFFVLAMAELAVGLGFWINRRAYRMPMEGRPDRPRRVGSRRLLTLSVATFFLYTGVEVSTGFWVFTLLSEGQGVDATVAGVAVAAHWGALFASRLLLGVLGDRMPPNPTIAVSVSLIVAGLALLWWHPSPFVAITGLIVAGFGSGPVFPLETMLTKRRFGLEYTPWAVGFQLGAATASAAIVPAVIGVLVNLTGPLVIAPALFVLAVGSMASVEALRVGSALEMAT
ncbi:MAG: MFS transporter [Acidimicrobiia bacterium]|jgi:fucose permease